MFDFLGSCKGFRLTVQVPSSFRKNNSLNHLNLGFNVTAFRALSTALQSHQTSFGEYRRVEKM